MADQLCSKSGVANLKQQLEEAGQTDAWAAQQSGNVQHLLMALGEEFHFQIWKIVNTESVFSRFMALLLNLRRPGDTKHGSPIQSHLIRCDMKNQSLG